MDGTAIVEGLRLEANGPVTSGGLYHHDVLDLMDVAEVLTLTDGALSDEERQSELEV